MKIKIKLLMGLAIIILLATGCNKAPAPTPTPLNRLTQKEVVVVNEKFGIRMTDVISPSERIKKLRYQRKRRKHI